MPLPVRPQTRIGDQEHKDWHAKLAAFYNTGSGSGTGGVPTGGTTGQYLRKGSSTDFDSGWDTVTAGEVGADPSGTAATAVATAVSRLYLNAKELGCVADSTTNNTTIIQSAIATLLAAGGGTLFFPRGSGKYLCNAQLTIDLTTLPNGPRGQVRFLGEGRDVSQLLWATDLGAGQYAIKPTGFIPAASFVMEHMGVCGPDHASGTLNWGTASPVAMDGVALNSRAKIYECAVRGFKSGVKVIGDHNEIHRTLLNRNYYGIYFSDPENGGFQVYDHSFRDVELQQSWWASIACSANSLIGNATFDHVWFCNGAPYGIYFEKGTLTGTALGNPGQGGKGSKGLWNCQFISGKWEGAGLAFIWDANYASGDINNFRVMEKVTVLSNSFHALRTANGVAIFSTTNPFDSYTSPAAWNYGLCMGYINDCKFYGHSTVDSDAKLPVVCATVTTLPANTYANGTSGVGATLTANANGVLTVDGVTPTINQRILVKNEAAGANNGIYQLSTVGTAGVPYVLTRSTDADTSAELPTGAYTYVTGGTLVSTEWWLTTTGAITVGTTTLTFTQTAAAGIENAWDVGWMARNEFHGGNFPVEITSDTSPGAPIIFSTTPLNTALRNINFTHTRLFFGDREAFLAVAHGTVTINNAVRWNFSTAGRVDAMVSAGLPVYCGIAAHSAVALQYVWVWNTGVVLGIGTAGGGAGFTSLQLLTYDTAAAEIGKLKARASLAEPVVARALQSAAADATGYVQLLSPYNDPLALPLAGGTLTGNVTMTGGVNIVASATTGTKIGTATTQLLGFYNATPVDQPAAVTDPTGGATVDAEARTAIVAVIDRLQELGLIA